tara:strand:- start:58873 stop:59739 length:867 start_codon:yes stop_codon:yes gene_type:complete
VHPKNPFQNNYNFEALIANHPPLKEFIFKNSYGNTTLNFADNKAVIALNTALLKTYFGINFWQIPEDNLCPPIPGRLDYLLHIADIFPQKEINLLDIGTGASLIYPILASQHFNWKCAASEVNKTSIRNAETIINKNPSLKNIDLRQQKFKNQILNGIIKTTDSFNVVVCNPPFYKNKTEAEKHNKRKVRNLQLQEEKQHNFGGLNNELWYKGGEVGFIKKMAEESVQFKQQVGWFTALVSQKENIKIVKRGINKTQPTQVKIVEMAHGNKQSRFIAWTFTQLQTTKI